MGGGISALRQAAKHREKTRFRRANDMAARGGKQAKTHISKQQTFEQSTTAGALLLARDVVCGCRLPFCKAPDTDFIIHCRRTTLTTTRVGLYFCDLLRSSLRRCASSSVVRSYVRASVRHRLRRLIAASFVALKSPLVPVAREWWFNRNIECPKHAVSRRMIPRLFRVLKL